MLVAPAQPRLPQIVPRSPAAAPSRLPMNPFGPAAAKPSANWDAHHVAAPHRRRSPKLPGFPQRSEASQSSTIVAVAPDPTESKPCSRSLICLQIPHRRVTEQNYFSENQKKDSTALSTNRPTGKSLEPVLFSTPSVFRRRCEAPIEIQAVGWVEPAKPIIFIRCN